MKRFLKDGKRLLRLAACLGAALLALGVWLYTRPGLYGEDGFYLRRTGEYRLNAQNRVTIAQDGFLVRLQGEEQWIAYAREGDSVRFTFEDGEQIEGLWADGQLTGAEGMPLWMDEGRAEESVRRVRQCETLVRMAQGEREARAPYAMLLAFALLYGLGAFSLFDPDRAAFFLQRWRFDQAELSAEGRWVERCAGLAAMVFGVVALFAPLWFS